MKELHVRLQILVMVALAQTAFAHKGVERAEEPQSRRALSTRATSTCSSLWQPSLQGDFIPIASDKMLPDRIYGRLGADLQAYVWVTGDDHRPLLKGSRVMGEQL